MNIVITVTSVIDDISNVFVPLLPPCVARKWYVVIHWLISAIAVVTCVGVNTAIGTTYDAVVTTI